MNFNGKLYFGCVSLFINFYVFGKEKLEIVFLKCGICIILYVYYYSFIYNYIL